MFVGCWVRGCLLYCGFVRFVRVVGDLLLYFVLMTQRYIGHHTLLVIHVARYAHAFHYGFLPLTLPFAFLFFNMVILQDYDYVQCGPQYHHGGAQGVP